ncbi:MAG TPA: TorF family putative porin [Telluria sp.]|nr:TorF family putative porin [Telluria sp.]
MRRLICAFALAAASAAAVADELAYNAGITSDYRYRGISQSRLQPALQGGADYTDSASGLYAGTWLSTIRWTSDAGGGGHAEWDVYAGRRGELAPGLAYDVGVLGYIYPANGLGKVSGFVNANTGEVYGQLGYGLAYAKYSHAVTNLFGVPDSRGSGYLDLGANVPLNDSLTLNLHAGRQTVRHTAAASYNDWKLGVTATFSGTSLSLAVIGTSADTTFYASPANGRFLGKRALVLGVTRTF